MRDGAKAIWFTTAETMVSVKASWCPLAVSTSGDPGRVGMGGGDGGGGACNHDLCWSLRKFELDGQYDDYLGTLEKLLLPR